MKENCCGHNHDHHHGHDECCGKEKKHDHECCGSKKEHKHNCGHKHHEFDGDSLEGLTLHLAKKLSHKGHGQGKVLRLLVKNGEMSQKDLQEAMKVQPGSISEVLNKLERKEFIARVKNKEDLRNNKILITEAGKEFIANKECKGKKSAFEVLSDEEKETLKNLLSKVVEAKR